MRRAEPRRVPTLPRRSADRATVTGPHRSARLSPQDLGTKVSILQRLAGAGQHPFNEVIGLLMRIEDRPGQSPLYHILRRNGDVMEVSQDSIVALKRLQPAGGPVKAPRSWEQT